MTTPTITETLQYPPGVTAADVTAYIILRGDTTSTAPGGYATRSGKTVAGRRTVRYDYPGSLGQLKTETGAALALNPNQDSGSADAITSPTGTYYELHVRMPGQPDWVRYLSVPDAAGPYRVDQVLTADPAAIATISAAGVNVTPRASMLLDATNVQNVIDEVALDHVNQAAFIPARRRWAQLMRSATTFDALFLGDSVSAGNVTSGLWYQQVWQSRLKQLGGLPAGGPGYRYGSTIDTRPPCFSTTTGGVAWDLNGLGNGAVLIPYGGSVSLNVATTLDRFIGAFIRSGDPDCSIIKVTDNATGQSWTVDPYDASLGYGGVLLTNKKYDLIWDSGTNLSPAQSRTLTISCATGARQNGIIFIGAHLLNGEGGGDILRWDAGISGATTATFSAPSASAHHETLRTPSGSYGHAAAIEFLELGLNETDPAVYGAGLVSLLAGRKALYTTASTMPTFALVLSWPKTGRTPAQNTPYLRAAINAAITSGGTAVFRGQDALGDFSTNPLGLSVDGVHPGADGHYLLGHTLAEWTARYLGITATALTQNAGDSRFAAKGPAHAALLNLGVI